MGENGGLNFMTMRFERSDHNTSHHAQAFCGIKHFDSNQVTSLSYEQLFQCIRELKLSYAVAEQMFIRMVFVIIPGNCDNHTKIFSFIHRKNGKWELVPVYDI